MVMIKYRTFWRRFFSGIVDTIVFLPVSLLGMWIGNHADTMPVAVTAVWQVFSYSVWYFYTVYFHGRYGQTLGKMLMRVKVVDVSETRAISYWQAFLRDIVPIFISAILLPVNIINLINGTSYMLKPGTMPDVISLVLSCVLTGWVFLEIISMLTNRKRRAIHDFIAGTVVVRTNVPDELDPGYEQALIREKKKSKFIAAGCLIFIVIFLIVCGVAGYIAYRIFFDLDHSSRREKPDVMNYPGVVTGTNFLSSDIFISDSRLEKITDLKLGAFVEGHSDVLAAVSTLGAIFYDASGKQIHERFFKEGTSAARIVSKGTDHDYVFINQGSWGLPASLINAEGETVWTYGGSPGVNCMSAGDLDGDGALDFAVGFNGGGGIHRLDANGKKVWEKDGGNIWHVEIVDTGNEGPVRIVHSDAGGDMYVRDADGNVVAQSQTHTYFSDFSICRKPDSLSETYCLLAEDDKIWLFDYNAIVVKTYYAPDCGTLGHAYGTPFFYAEGESEYLAIICDYPNWKTTMFYVYNPAGELVYQEVIPESCASIMAVKNGSSGQDKLLIGGTGKIFSYTRPDIW